MSRIEFQPWPKIGRLHKDIVVTEKIDGTNAAVVIVDAWDLLDATERGYGAYAPTYLQQWVARGEKIVEVDEDGKTKFYLVAAQSRKQLITPSKDNFGFAAWAYEHAADLVRLLGPGRHFGEWWGSGIQRGYGLPKGERRFSLFNTSKHDFSEYAGPDFGLRVVPTLYKGPFNELEIEDAMQELDEFGSHASQGFKPAEGVVIYHTASNALFKWPFDEAPKGTPYTPPTLGRATNELLG